MIRYYGTSIVFQEVPDEIALAVEITACPHRCPECHSPWLREDVGVELTPEECGRLAKANPGITCVCFMGGDGRHGEIASLCDYVRSTLGLKAAVYSGDDEVDLELIGSVDYYKVGSYDKEKGPLSSPTTNQRFFRVEGAKAIDITNRFLPKGIGRQ